MNFTKALILSLFLAMVFHGQAHTFSPENAYLDSKLANVHIDISELPSGIYNVRISNAHKSLSPKAFVKQ